MSDATPLSAPSDWLAVLADAITKSLFSDHQALKQALDGLELDMTPPEEWLLPSYVLCDEIVNFLGVWPPTPPTSAKAFALYVAALQRLDRWHRPVLPSETTLPRLADHEAILDRLALEDRFNSNPECGTVIPRRAFGSPFLQLDSVEIDWDTVPSPYSILCSLLDICVFLPSHVTAGDPDAESSTIGSRRIELLFHRFPPEEIGLLWPPDVFRIAVAPVAEAENDARFWVEDNRYAIEPNVSFTRLEALLQGAFSNHVNLLLLPEMTVDALFLPRFRERLRSLQKEIALSDPDWKPSIRLILIGVIEAPHEVGAPHRNYVAAIKANGQILFTQDKLSHWNLDARAQSRFGVDDNGYIELLHENTVPGTNVMIVEFDGLGRLMALICADMSHNMPGDWIVDNIGLDWLYAPIMDASTCWSQGRFPWIVQRAIRICDRAGTTVMIANSMVMTHWNNRVTARNLANSSYHYKTYDICGVGFLVRRDDLNTLINHTTVDLSAVDSPVLRIIDWSVGWTSPPTL